MNRDVGCVVVGAGVVGLSTAIRLRQAGVSVRVIAHLPPLSTTSAAATASCGPSFAPIGSRISDWEQATVGAFEALYDMEAGVRPARGMIALRRDVGTPTLPKVFDLRIAKSSELPAGFESGFWVTVPLIDMPIYLRHLAQQLEDLGVHIEVGRVTSLDDPSVRGAVIVNCAGIGARQLAGDWSVVPSRGQQLIVSNPGLEEWFGEVAFGAEAWVSWFPHGDHVVLGGTAHRGDYRLEPDPVLAEEIWLRCLELEPSFAGAEVVSHRVGLRPTRPEVRLEVGSDGGALVHNYGHGGVGVTVSWGCAEEAARLALEMAST